MVKSFALLNLGQIVLTFRGSSDAVNSIAFQYILEGAQVLRILKSNVSVKVFRVLIALIQNDIW
jgi:predicted histidine transporter YuiF (NhaC family)